MRVNGIEVDLDVHQYLESKGLPKVRSVGENEMACCPFHRERTPSFGVHRHSGQYHCFGCGAKGSFGQLVKELDGFDTVYDAEQFLVVMYGRYVSDIGATGEPLELEFGVTPDPLYGYEVDRSIMTRLRYRHPYLENRGITEKWQRIFDVGYDRDHAAITIPWFDESGRLMSIKMRSVRGKRFWYDPPMPSGLKGRTWFALDKVVRWGIRKVAITEAEIDCMSVWQSECRIDGDAVGAIAIGGNQPTNLQIVKLIRTLPADAEIIVFTDNDPGGDLAKNILGDRLVGRFRLSEVDWGTVHTGINGKPPKDANDVSIDDRRTLLQRRVPVGVTLTL